jgi:succinate dehydrogenase / fumarate reductase flavoprotein subunit
MHYAMGGIATDKDGATSIPGVYAAGECACVSVHGANRLGGNSLLETIVFGARSARHAVDYIKRNGKTRRSERALRAERERIAELLGRQRGERAPQLRKRMNATMSDNVFIFRNPEQLQRAVGDLREVREAAKSMIVMDKSKTFNTDLVNALETQFLIEIAQTIALGALNRDESRGAQARTDFPDRNDDKWLVHSLMYRTDGDPRPDYSRKVTFTKWQPQVRTY